MSFYFDVEYCQISHKYQQVKCFIKIYDVLEDHSNVISCVTTLLINEYLSNYGVKQIIYKNIGMYILKL
jgi:hypothetical protein